MLKQIADTILVTGPFKINGVPLRRINPAYVVATSTKVDLSAASGLSLDKFDETYFKVKNRDGLRARTTRERSVSRSGFRVIGPISCKKYLNPTGIGLIPSENSSTPGRERTGRSRRLSGSG